ncbi:MAG: hypothetical protein LBV00_05640, partial [Propionibacteriaceae bacterium]|nr:hypothetical protein [Propionibacteriaceae bacterium]
MGATWLLDGLWRRLEIGDAIRQVVGPRRFSTDVERVVFALMANRAVDPMSKLSAAEWALLDTVISGLDSMSDDQAYRVMDILVEADTQAKAQEAVFFSAANLLNLEVDVLLFDTTNTYFQVEDWGEPLIPDSFVSSSGRFRPGVVRILVGTGSRWLNGDAGR